MLYGGLARGRYRPGKSDVDVIVLLHDASARALAAITPPLRKANRAAGVDAMVLAPDEVERVAATFPVKFLDIQKHHIVLAGADPFTGLSVSREQTRLRIEQELTNSLLRLRRRLAMASDDPVSLAQTLVLIARPLAIELAALLRLADEATPADDRSAVVFELASKRFNLDGAALSSLAALRHDTAPAARPAELLGRVLTCIEGAVRVARELKKPER